MSTAGDTAVLDDQNAARTHGGIFDYADAHHRNLRVVGKLADIGLTYGNLFAPGVYNGANGRAAVDKLFPTGIDGRLVGGTSVRDVDRAAGRERVVRGGPYDELYPTGVENCPERTAAVDELLTAVVDDRSVRTAAGNYDTGGRKILISFSREHFFK